MKKSTWITATAAAGCCAMILLGIGSVVAKDQMSEYDRRTADPRNKQYTVGDKKSGYVYMTAITRDMQDDDFANPAFLWVQTGEAFWNTKMGSKGKSCASCHKSAAESMKGVYARYPVYDPKSKKMIALQHKILSELKDKMGAKAIKWESDQMNGLVAYIGLQSRGMPQNVSAEGPAAKFYKEGEKFFNQRRGLLDMACKHCHVDNAGKMARSNLLSEARPNGFPTYRLKWQKIGSLHRRFSGCNKNIRAKPYKRGSPEYTNLELFLRARSNGLPIETPSVRN
jgi:sulfur-oxidizing protein SoxA